LLLAQSRHRTRNCWFSRSPSWCRPAPKANATASGCAGGKASDANSWMDLEELEAEHLPGDWRQAQDLARRAGHVGGVEYGDIRYTEPLLNNLHIVEPTIRLLEHY